MTDASGTDRSATYRTFDRTIRGASSNDEFLSAAGFSLEATDGPIETRVRALRFDTIIAAHAITTPVLAVWQRDRPSSQRRALYVFVNRGDVSIQGDVSWVSNTGDGLGVGVGVILPGSGRAEIRVSSDAELLLFSFDIGEIHPLTISEGHVFLAPDSPVLRVAYAHLYGAVRVPGESTVGASRILRELTRDLARALVMETSTPPNRTDTVSQVLVTIRRRFRDAEFTADQLAAELGIGRRSLERACAAKGIRISDEIRRQRAEYAHRLVSEGTSRQLDSIAEESGFRSTEAMRRAFARYYRASPSAARTTTE